MSQPVDFLIELLCQQGTTSQCQSFVSSYSDPASQLVFFLFFPLVFLILFVHVLGDGISRNTGAKLDLLVSIAIFVFIVFQGWYHIFLTLSKFWFIAVIILGGFWALTRKMGPAGGGGGGGTRSKTSPFSGLREYAEGKIKRKLEGKEKKKLVQIEQTMENLKALVNNIEKEVKTPSPGTNIADLHKEFGATKRVLLTYIDELEDWGRADIGGVDWEIEEKGGKYKDELKALDERVKKATKK